MQAAFVALLDPPSYNYVRTLQVKIYSLFGTKETLKLEPHITIKYAFDINNLNSVEKYFDELVNQTKTFELTLEGISSFEKDIVFLDVRNNSAITNLHLKILEDISQKFSVNPGEFEGEEMHFHTTLAYKDISPETFKKIKYSLKSEQSSFSFKVKRLGMYLLPDSSMNWFIYKIGNLA